MSKARKKKNKRLGLILLIEVLVFIGLLVGFGWYYVNSKLDKVVDETVVAEKEEIDVSDAVTEALTAATGETGLLTQWADARYAPVSNGQSQCPAHQRRETKKLKP